MAIYWHGIIDSTNNEAYRHIDSAQDFDVWAASFQTAGRGQKGNKWESKGGENLTFTILLRPFKVKVEKQFLISQATSLGITDYLQTNFLEARIKWPNDIYVNDRKICGILIEHYFNSVNLSVSIIGIGVNLNQEHFSADAPNPTSMSLESGIKRDPVIELPLLLECIKPYFDSIYKDTRGKSSAAIEQKYIRKLYRLGEWHNYQECNSGKIFSAKITGVDNSACLVLEHEDGRSVRYAFKEIRYLS
ncbi:MAG: biotin--[acetyl-CoA-carboxylase] ligase [Bacteroidales bacterium]|nr:biotin--[acetyl-CoA-carboxylase] ligase [Bacteroidales bacterium]MDD2424755.1 biotin--[acetyl-CoA-carboxylase] ligase [Bacteroidales bacterium]MDD3988677.1 biotin--[acetyl-CoA-carboxylase] ligase [Bacteroidales bacterium]